MFQTSVTGPNRSQVTTLCSHDRSPQRRAGGHGSASDGIGRGDLARPDRRRDLSGGTTHPFSQAHIIVAGPPPR